MKQSVAAFIYTLIAAFAIGCSGSSSPTPAAPSSSTPAPASTAPAPSTAPTAAAALSISTVTATTQAMSGGGYQYNVSITVRETGGRSSATISSVKTQFSRTGDSGSCTFTSAFSSAVTAGGTANSGPMSCTDSAATLSTLMTSVVVTVTFADSAGVSGTATSASTSVTPPASTPSPTTTSSYAVTVTSATCSVSNTRNGVISASGTASTSAVGARVQFYVWAPSVSSLSCGGWTSEVSNDPLGDYAVCRRSSSSQPTSITWSGTFTSYGTISTPSSGQVRAFVYDSNGTSQANWIADVTCK